MLRLVLGLAPTVLLTAAAFAVADTRPAPARILYVASGHLYTIGADGSDRRLVAKDTGNATWSPDGRSLAFIRTADEDARIWTAAADGTGARPITKPPRPWYDADPSWSPDGRRVVFVRTTARAPKFVTTLMSADAAGGDERTIARVASTRSLGLGEADWSPDGGRILVSLTPQDDDYPARSSLQVVDAATGKRTVLVRDAADGSWSPSGDRIAYVRVPRSCEEYECRDLYVANADGSGARRITTLRDRGDFSSPSWSPDGERIAFASDRNGGSTELYSVRPDGTCLTWLTNGTAYVYGPEFEPVAGPPTDPGGCGAVPREPLVEVDTSELEHYRDHPVFWLGPRFGNLLLTYTEAEPGESAEVEYEDCASFEREDCPQPVSLSQYSTCDYTAGYYEDGSDLTRRNGVLVYEPKEPSLESPSHALIGPTALTLDARNVDEVLAGLRQFPEDAPPPGGLPAAELPDTLWRSLERTRAAVRKYGVAGAARRLKKSRGSIRRTLALDRRLRKLGPFGRTKCPR